MRVSISSPKELILSCGLEGCLNLYEVRNWLELNRRLESAPLKDRSGQRAFKRMLYASASEVEFDDEGRILVPQHLALYARLKRDVAIIGVGEKIELWAKHLWTRYQARQSGAFERYASKLEI